MSRTGGRTPAGGFGWLALAMLAGLVALGAAANGRGLLEVLAALGALAFVLAVAALWGWTRREAEKRPPLTRGQKAWNVVVFVIWLGVMAALVCWYAADRKEREERRNGAPEAGAGP
jgi:hypothetical protein